MRCPESGYEKEKEVTGKKRAKNGKRKGVSSRMALVKVTRFWVSLARTNPS